MRLDWDKYFIALAKLAACRSGCNSRPTGAIIVKNRRIIATGYNGSLPGQPQCTDKGEKFCLRRSKVLDDKGEKKYLECPSIHAEQNAINQVAKFGAISLENAIIYCTLEPCIFCLKNIASVGIKEVIYEIPYYSNDKERDKYWKERAEKYKIKTRQVQLTIDESVFISLSISNFTSERRI